MAVGVIPRCEHCLVRHAEGEDCVEPGEEGLITRGMLVDAFRRRDGVCLSCQCIMFLDNTPIGHRLRHGCPTCGRPWERFEEDDLEETVA